MGARDRIVKALMGIKAYHSSPHDFDKFDLSKIGTGEGAQAYGHGLYFAENPEVSGIGGDYWQSFLRGRPADDQAAAKFLMQAGGDRDKAIGIANTAVDTARNFLAKNAGTPLEPEIQKALAAHERSLELLRGGGQVGPRTYEVNINADPSHLIDYDAPLSAQTSRVRDAFAEAGKAHEYRVEPAASGKTWSVLHPGGWVPGGAKNFYRSEGAAADAVKEMNAARSFRDMLPRTAEQLAPFTEAGVPGVRYLDQGSRGAGAGTSNYVVFDPSIVDITKKYGGAIAAPVLGATAAQNSYEDVP